ncbi:MAG: hypothetical protein RRY34_01690 [Victivallaceae bacterium]
MNNTIKIFTCLLGGLASTLLAESVPEPPFEKRGISEVELQQKLNLSNLSVDNVATLTALENFVTEHQRDFTPEQARTISEKLIRSTAGKGVVNQAVPILQMILPTTQRERFAVYQTMLSYWGSRPDEMMATAKFIGQESNKNYFIAPQYNLAVQLRFMLMNFPHNGTAEDYKQLLNIFSAMPYVNLEMDNYSFYLDKKYPDSGRDGVKIVENALKCALDFPEQTRGGFYLLAAVNAFNSGNDGYLKKVDSYLDMADKLSNNAELRGKILTIRVKNLLRQKKTSDAKKLLLNANENKNYTPAIRNEIFYECGSIFWQEADVEELDRYFSGINFNFFVPAYQLYIFDSISRLYERHQNFSQALHYAKQAAQVEMEEQNALFSKVPLWLRVGQLEAKSGNQTAADVTFTNVLKDGERQLSITTKDDEAEAATIFVAMAQAMRLKSDYDAKKYEEFLLRALADRRVKQNDIGLTELQNLLDELKQQSK